MIPFSRTTLYFTAHPQQFKNLFDPSLNSDGQFQARSFYAILQLVQLARPDISRQMKALAALPKFPFCFFGCLVSGVFSPTGGSRSPLSGWRLFSSTTRITQTKF
jgi:hypothetical protein